MAEPLFDIVFRGDIVMGHKIQDVKVRLGQLFKVDAAKVEALFAGGAVPLKRDIDKATAEKYKTILAKAGAQVQIRAAGGAAKVASAPRRADHGGQSQSAPPHSPRSTGRDQTGAPTAWGFSLAPLGSNLLSSSEARQVPSLDLDLSGISIKPMEGDLLEDSEKSKTVSAEMQVSDYELAAVGTDLLEGFRRDPLPLPEIDVDFEIAEVGAVLSDPAEQPEQAPVEVDISHLDVVPIDVVPIKE